MQIDLHTTLERFLLEQLVMELGNIRACLAFLAPRPGDRAVADLGVARIDLQLSRLEDTARRMSRLLREDRAFSQAIAEPLLQRTGTTEALEFALVDEMVFDQTHLGSQKTGIAVGKNPVPQASVAKDGNARIDHHIDSIADVLYATPSPIFRSCRNSAGRGI